MIAWRMRITCSIPQATNTQTQSITLTAVSAQKCLHERASVLGYTHIASPNIQKMVHKRLTFRHRASSI